MTVKIFTLPADKSIEGLTAMWSSSKFKKSSYYRDDMTVATPNQRSRPRSKIHLLRSKAQIVVVAENGEPLRTIPAQALLNDLKPTGITLFSAATLPIREQVTVSIDRPMHFFAAGLVTACAPFQYGSRIFSPFCFIYRVNIQFAFQSEEEARLVREYCAELARGTLRTAA
jgi:hypothetical protein